MPPRTDAAAPAPAPPPPTIATPSLLRDWTLPAPGSSKYGRVDQLPVLISELDS